MSTNSVVHAPAPLRQHPRFVFHHSYSTVIEFKWGNKKIYNLILTCSKTDAYEIIDRKQTNFNPKLFYKLQTQFSTFLAKVLIVDLLLSLASGVLFYWMNFLSR